MQNAEGCEPYQEQESKEQGAARASLEKQPQERGRPWNVITATAQPGIPIHYHNKKCLQLIISLESQKKSLT